MAGVDQAVQQACRRLKASGRRITGPRVAMLQVLAHYSRPCAIGSLHKDLAGEYDLVTLYRSLAAMEEAGIVRRIFGKSGLILYQLNDSPERLQVLSNAESVDVIEEVTPSPEMILALQSVEDTLRARGYTSVTHTVQFFADRTRYTIPLAGGPGGEFINGL